MSEVDLTLFYESHARSCDPKDFQGQVMRNPLGKSAGPDQVAMIVDAIGKGLEIRPDDVLLDLCCGNGAITDPVFARCRGGLGVDFTPYLIEVAKTNFESSPDRLYLLADALEFVETTDDTKRFTKAFCYGAFQCLPESKAIGVLAALRRRFPNLQRMFIGNLPDFDRVGNFFERDIPSREELKRYDMPFGIWRTEQEVAKLAAGCGWRTEFSRMPSAFHTAHYKFDATLVPKSLKDTITTWLRPIWRPYRARV
jgi:SAM-dependent methyltransferase